MTPRLAAALMGLFMGAARAETPAEITELMQRWAGVHDSAVQVILDDHVAPARRRGCRTAAHGD
ncbi:MAG: hypothetical protein WDM77_05710 [Steroidobacteraceae bacterium]